MKKVLFVCSANKQRSKTAEDFFSEEYPDFEFMSAGTNLKICKKEGTNPLTKEFLSWADHIYVMESRHRTLINDETNREYNQKIVVLEIPDRFKYYQRELIDLLYSKVNLQ